jgi:DNA-binding LytR/AlgR family response regulator
MHLSDGKRLYSFENIEYEKPVIFTTAYDEYSIRAFKLNSIDYLLKPIAFDELSAALNKLKKLHKNREGFLKVSEIKELLRKETYKSRFLTKTGSKYSQIPVEDISLFYSEGKLTYLVQRISGNKYLIDTTMEELENKLLDPDKFYRISRKSIICSDAVKSFKTYPGNRLIIDVDTNLDFDLVVSREKVTSFKKWIDR